MRTALEIINISVVACKTKSREIEQEEQKTNNYSEYFVGHRWHATVLIFIEVFSKKEKCVCVCTCAKFSGISSCFSIFWGDRM